MPLTPSALEAIIAAALAALGPDAERHNVPWKGGERLSSVISMETGHPLLSIRNHRYAPHLREAPDYEDIKSDPNSAASQDRIAEILRGTEGFEELRKNLAEEGQNEPGMVTHKGILVNGHRRCVAMRDNGQTHINLIVLPSDASEKDIDLLEVMLQARKDHKARYPFSSRLLQARELATTYGFSNEQIALKLGDAASSEPAELRRGAKKVSLAFLQLITLEEIRTRSGGRISLTAFDDKIQTITDIVDAYESLKTTDPVGASRVREQRILGALGEGVFYRHIRSVNKDPKSKYLATAVEDDDVLNDLLVALRAEAPPAPAAPVVHAFFGGGAPATAASNLSPLVDALARSHGTDTIEVGGKSFDRQIVVGRVQAAFAEGDRELQADEQRANRQPKQLVEDATLNLGSALTDWIAAPSDAIEMRAALADLDRAVAALKRAVGAK